MNVLCISNRSGWFDLTPNKITTIYLWGLIKKVSDTPNKKDGPDYGDVCTVVSTYEFEGKVFYKLKGWLHVGGYHSINFIPIQEESADAEVENKKQTSNA